MFILIRTLCYATLFIGFVLVYLPSRVLAWVGISRPPEINWPQLAGIVIGCMGAALALWCVGVFAHIGKGTPAPFDPPRRLVIRGPYKFVRNPMYIGASLALTGAAFFFTSFGLLAFACGFLLVAHCFVVVYEEPTLRHSFGQDYLTYCQHVRRWQPTI